MPRLAYLLAWLTLALIPAEAQAVENDPAKRLDAASDIIEKTVGLPEKGVPPVLLQHAQGIAVIPGVIKGGFVVAGSYGRGVVTVRDRNGQWCAPIFIRLIGGSVGWQVGAESSDAVLVFKTPRSVEGLLRGKFKLGVDASIAAGPVGRSGEAATDAQLKAEIYSYSRSRGLFAGIALQGADLDVDHDANREFYGKEATTEDIRKGKVSLSPAADRFLKTVGRATSQ